MKERITSFLWELNFWWYSDLTFMIFRSRRDDHVEQDRWLSCSCLFFCCCLGLFDVGNVDISDRHEPSSVSMSTSVRGEDFVNVGISSVLRNLPSPNTVPITRVSRWKLSAGCFFIRWKVFRKDIFGLHLTKGRDTKLFWRNIEGVTGRQLHMIPILNSTILCLGQLPNPPNCSNEIHTRFSLWNLGPIWDPGFWQPEHGNKDPWYWICRHWSNIQPCRCHIEEANLQKSSHK